MPLHNMWWKESSEERCSWVTSEPEPEMLQTLYADFSEAAGGLSYSSAPWQTLAAY